MPIPALPLALLLHALPPIDAAALEQHLDAEVPEQLRRTGVPGVVVSVVQGDRVLLAKGWGLADVEAGVPMDGERTVVRVASISKTFTATAIARLEARGELSVDEPVDRWLGERTLPQPYGTVTLRDLMGHRAGLLNHNVGRVLEDRAEPDLAGFLAQTMPPQVRPPGVAVLYVNHGPALAGLVIERVTGEPFAEHVAHTLLQPLRMRSSSFGLEPELAAALARSYLIEDGQAVPQPYLHFRTIPASTLHSTAADMTSYMIMHLRGGRFDGQQVLSSEAAARMRTPGPAIHPALPSYHYAFAHGHTAGHRTRSHGGSVPAFLSRVVLFDEHEVGVFVAQNAMPEALAGPIVESIAERFLPAPAIAPVVAAGDGRPTDPDALIGDYTVLDALDTPAFTRPAVKLLAKTLRVRVDDDGFLRVDGERFVRTDDAVYQREREGDTPHTIVFTTDEDGRVRYLHRELSSAERRPWHASPWVQLPALGLAALGLLLVALGRGGDRRGPARGEVVRVAAILALLGAVVPYVYVAWNDAGQVEYLRPMRLGEPAWVVAVRGLVPLAMTLSWLAVALGLVARRSAPSRRGGSLRLACAVALATTVLPAVQLYWRTPPPGLVMPSR